MLRLGCQCRVIPAWSNLMQVGVGKVSKESCFLTAEGTGIPVLAVAGWSSCIAPFSRLRCGGVSACSFIQVVYCLCFSCSIAKWDMNTIYLWKSHEPQMGEFQSYHLPL